MRPPACDRGEQSVEADLVEAEQHLDLGALAGLEHPVALHEEALVEDERRVRDERRDAPDPLGVLGATGRDREHLERELVVGQRVVGEEVLARVLDGPEDGRLAPVEHPGAVLGAAPADEELEAALAPL